MRSTAKSSPRRKRICHPSFGARYRNVPMQIDSKLTQLFEARNKSPYWNDLSKAFPDLGQLIDNILCALSLYFDKGPIRPVERLRALYRDKQRVQFMGELYRCILNELPKIRTAHAEWYSREITWILNQSA